MATVTCELHTAFQFYHWTGFYRVVSDELLMIGPYMGSHGCLTIPFHKGVCGAAASTRRTQLVPDVHRFPGHIACASRCGEGFGFSDTRTAAAWQSLVSGAREREQ